MPAPSTSTRSATLSDLIWRHKKTIIFFPLFAVALGTLFFLFCPRTYRSEARLFLRVGRESVGIDPTATTGQVMPLYTSDRKDEVKSAEGVFRGRNVVALVVDKVGPDVVLGRGQENAAPPSALASVIGKPIGVLMGMIRSVDPISEREEAIIKVERSLTVTAERQATVLVVQYDAPSPQMAQKMCQAVVEVAQEEHMRIHRNEESRPFFTEQQKRLKAQLDKSLAALRDSKNSMGLASVEQRRQTLESQYSAIALDRLSTDQQLATAQARIEDLRRQLAEIPERSLLAETKMPNQGADLLRDKIYELEVKSMDLGARYVSTHPLVRAVNEQLKEAKDVLAAEAEQRTATTDDLNPIHRDLLLAMKQEQSVVAGLKSRLVELDQQKGAVLAELRELNQHDVVLDQLTRESELARAKYLQYARTMEEARIDKELENDKISNISVAQQATLTEKPVVPSRLLVALGTLLLATGGTFAMVRFGEYMNAPLPMDDVELNGELRRPPRRIEPRELATVSNGESESDDPRLLPR